MLKRGIRTLSLLNQTSSYFG